VGARSGESRVAHVARFADGDKRWLVVGSAGAGGHNPGAVYNLASHPHPGWVEIGKSKSKVRPEILAGDERAAAWKRIVAESPALGGHVDKNDREDSVVPPHRAARARR